MSQRYRLKIGRNGRAHIIDMENKTMTDDRGYVHAIAPGHRCEFAVPLPESIAVPALDAWQAERAEREAARQAKVEPQPQYFTNTSSNALWRVLPNGTREFRTTCTPWRSMLFIPAFCHAIDVTEAAKWQMNHPEHDDSKDRVNTTIANVKYAQTILDEAKRSSDDNLYHFPVVLAYRFSDAGVFDLRWFDSALSGAILHIGNDKWSRHSEIHNIDFYLAQGWSVVPTANARDIIHAAGLLCPDEENAQLADRLCHTKLEVAYENEISKLRDELDLLRSAVKIAGFEILKAANGWSIVDVSEKAKYDEDRTKDVINQNIAKIIAADLNRAYVRKLTDCMQETIRFAKAHHGNQPLCEIMHGLTIDIPCMLEVGLEGPSNDDLEPEPTSIAGIPIADIVNTIKVRDMARIVIDSVCNRIARAAAEQTANQKGTS